MNSFGCISQFDSAEDNLVISVSNDNKNHPSQDGISKSPVKIPLTLTPKKGFWGLPKNNIGEKTKCSSNFIKHMLVKFQLKLSL